LSSQLYRVNQPDGEVKAEDECELVRSEHLIFRVISLGSNRLLADATRDKSMYKQAVINGIFITLSLIWVAASAQVTPSPTPSVTSNDYRLNPGDILSISVWKEEDLQREVLIRPDGKFSFPLTGDILASGRSVEEVRAQIKRRLSRYIPDLVVSVSVLQISGNKIYVIGQVSRPGEIIANPHIDVVQALAIAGGNTPFADLSNISILRRTPTGLRSIPFNYSDIEKGKRLEQNIMLQAGDVVVVP
jgi:polysaccharide export outer membrane protein